LSPHETAAPQHTTLPRYGAIRPPPLLTDVSDRRPTDKPTDRSTDEPTADVYDVGRRRRKPAGWVQDPRSKKQKKPLMNNVPSLFNEMDPPLLSHKMALIAFYLSMKDFRTRLKVDKAQRLKEMLDDDCTLFRGLPQDILHTCRPIECEGIEVDPGVRACGMLSILYLDAETAFENGIPDQKFIFLVSYCLRMHVVKRSMKQFKDLNRMLLRELLMMPGFPGQSELKTYWGTLTAGLQSLATLGLGNSDERGRELSNYAMRVHSSLAARGVFSPRLMEFLGIDVARVFIEEDGRIAKVRGAPPPARAAPSSRGGGRRAARGCLRQGAASERCLRGRVVPKERRLGVTATATVRRDEVGASVK
jgi:hypothetical protein